MKKFLIDFLRPLDNLLFNYLAKIGGILPILNFITAGLSYKKYRDGRKERKDATKRSRESIENAIESLRKPIDILKDAYGEDGMFSEEMMGKILDVENALMGPLTDLLKDYGQTMAFGEGGLQEIFQTNTEEILDRMKELGPEFREALEDPRVASLLNEQIENFKQNYSSSQVTSEEREAAAKELDQQVKDSFTQAGVSIEALANAEVESAKPFVDKLDKFDTSALKDFDFDPLRNVDLSKSDAFLGNLRTLTDAQIAEADRLGEVAKGPLSFEAQRNADQQARLLGGSIGRQRDASALARAALGREDAVQQREDRATKARQDAFTMAGTGAQAGLAQEQLRTDIEKSLASLGLTAQQQALNLDLAALGAGANAALNLDKLGLMRDESVVNKSLEEAKLGGLFAAQARQEALNARNEGRAEFRDIFNAAKSASVDPSPIFFAESAPVMDLYSSIIGGQPGTIFTDMGSALDIGSQYDTNIANIYTGQGEAEATRAAGAGEREASAFGSFMDILGSESFQSDFKNLFK